MNTKRIAIIAFILGVALSLSIVTALAQPDQEHGKSPSYPINESGLTYGSASDAASPEEEPDLISAVGVDGIEGYVYSKDLQEGAPNTPEEAIVMTKAMDEKMASLRLGETLVVRTIPLYDIDGKTIIGKFAISNTKL
ncbi:MAG: hypothetical protein WDA11_10295 [Thiohalomonadaceae bacterium]